MFYLVTGIIELVSIVGISVFHSGTITNVSGLVLFITAIMIPLANFMAMARSFGHQPVNLLLALTSIICTMLELLGLLKSVSIPDIWLKIMFVYIGVSSILVYVDMKLKPGHRSVTENQQDTLR